jgi:hypothetical protein
MITKMTNSTKLWIAVFITAIAAIGSIFYIGSHTNNSATLPVIVGLPATVIVFYIVSKALDLKMD